MTQDSAPMASNPDFTIQALAQRLKSGLQQVVFGQEQTIELLLIGLLAKGHMLLEGFPGTAKTTLVKTLAQLTNLQFSRIQLTPDLLPAEITGTSVYDLGTKSFHFKPGPIFTEILLADELNRTPPKTQSALLEAMQEHQVTVDGASQALPALFTVIATLNPLEFEGTFPLPEAQLDRFLLKINVGYPSPEAEKQMLIHAAQAKTMPQPLESSTGEVLSVISQEELTQAQALLQEIIVSEPIMDYILSIVQRSRESQHLSVGASPRSALALMAASRAHAAINGQAFVSPDNVKAVASAVLSHRVLLNSDAELDNITAPKVIQQLLLQVPVPR